MAPCTPAPGSSVDPCEPDVRLPQIGGAAGGIADLGDEPWSIRETLDGYVVPFVPHLVLRGTYLPGTVRCTAGDRYRPQSHVDLDELTLTLNTLSFKCYADVLAHAYIVGDGPSTVTVQVDWDIYRDSSYTGAAANFDVTVGEWIEELRQGYEQLLIRGRFDYEHYYETGNERLTGGIVGREVVLFIGPTDDLSAEAWLVMATWDVQRQEDGTVVAVHPDRELWRRLRPDDYPTHRAALEMELPAFTQAVTTANQARVAANGGRIGADPGLPMLVANVDQLRQFMTAVGAFGHPDGPPAQPPPVPVCATGTAVTDPGTNRGLVYDCGALLAGKDELRGTATLDWSVDTSITGWEGVTTSGTPSRVTELDLSSEGLNGTIPAELGTLFELTTLDLSMNSLTGDIPAELGRLPNLEELRLSGNSLTGCIPLALKDVATNDLSLLNLSLYCRPPAPGNLSAGTAGETSVALSWDTVSNASTYRVEYWDFAIGYWTVDDDTITGTAHTVDGLLCEEEYGFRVSAYGSGTVYAAAWSEPSAALSASTSGCVPPTFGAVSAFSINGDAAAGAVVGSVTATGMGTNDPV